MNDHPQPAARPPLGITTWVLVSAVASAAGWLLSAIHQLNAVGYICIFLPLTLFYFWRQKNQFRSALNPLRLRRIFRRARRPLPLCFFALAFAAFAGGVLHSPANYDALAYRVPRVLHWLAHGQWHWVHTAFPRLNDRAAGQEWLMAPIIALTGSMRGTFLPSLISFLLLPGLLFSMLTRFGVRPRIAWPWMWIIPAGYCYATQAGGIANDLLGAAYAVAAFDFALRLRLSGRLSDFWLFTLAAALMTNAKASNLLLALPLFLIVCPRWQLLFAKPVANFLIITLAVLASFLPIAFFNWKFAGDWTGMKLEGPMKPYPVQLGINSVNLLVQNFSPPVFPFTSHLDHFLRVTLHLNPDTVRCWRISELAEEGGAGLGLGVSLLLLISVMITLSHRSSAHRDNAPAPHSFWWKLILWSPYLSLFVFCFKAQAVNSVSRLLTPYWPVLIVPFLLFSFDARLLRARWWRSLAVAFSLMTLGLVILEPSRPLWPANTILTRLQQSHPQSRLITRIQKVYAVYAERPQAFAPLVAALPTDTNVFAVLTFDDPETSLWWPLGSRRIEHITTTDDSTYLASQGFKYVLAPDYCAALSMPVETLIQKYNATVIKKIPLPLRADQAPVDWYILQINTPANPK